MTTASRASGRLSTPASSMAEREGRPRAISFEDHAFVGEWLAERLGEAGIEHIGNIEDPREFVPRARSSGASIAIVDAIVPNADPFAACMELSKSGGGMRIVFLSGTCTRRQVRDAIVCGAVGYLSKADEPNAIVEGLRHVASGRCAFTAEVLRSVPELEEYHARPAEDLEEVSLKADGKLAELTDREREVLVLMAQGLTRAEIAESLSRSPKTIDKHRGSLMHKLDIHDRAQLVLFAVRAGLVTPSTL